MHFPTDNGLLYDAIRKTIVLTSRLCLKYKLKGWRQKSHNLKKIKSITTTISKIKRSRPRKESSILDKKNKLEKAYKKLINRSEEFIEKANLSIEEVNKKATALDFILIKEIEKFINYTKIFIDQITRRVFKEEKISHKEKIFSIFEPHTEWICKGKVKAPFELGKRVAIVEDQYGFILSSKVMNRETDEKVTIPIIKETKKRFDNITTCSFDKGFYSKKNKEELSKLLEFPILPKKGKLSKKDMELEHSKEFVKYRKKHSAVESAINALEIHGLDKCLDKGFFAFKRFVALAVASRNIQKLGAILKRKYHRKKHKLKIAV